MERFPLRRAWWAVPFIGVLAPGRHAATIADDALEVRMGWLGSARVPLERVASVGTMHWPWWGGVGVRIARGTVAFVADSGPAALVSLTDPVAVRAPLRWRTRRLVLGVEDVEGFSIALAARRRAAGWGDLDPGV